MYCVKKNSSSHSSCNTHLISSHRWRVCFTLLLRWKQCPFSAPSPPLISFTYWFCLLDDTLLRLSCIIILTFSLINTHSFLPPLVLARKARRRTNRRRPAWTATTTQTQATADHKPRKKRKKKGHGRCSCWPDAWKYWSILKMKTVWSRRGRRGEEGARESVRGLEESSTRHTWATRDDVALTASEGCESSSCLTGSMSRAPAHVPMTMTRILVREDVLLWHVHSDIINLKIYRLSVLIGGGCAYVCS